MAADEAEDTTNVTDKDRLVADAQSDPLVFATLYRRYLTRVYRHVRPHVPTNEDAADITQTAL
jgi:DNA-directed RNA polymerase specialized sigma24 family protein